MGLIGYNRDDPKLGIALLSQDDLNIAMNNLY